MRACSAHESDRRSQQLALTDAGTEVLARAVPLVEAVYASAWTPLPEPQLHALASQLQLVQAHLHADQP